MPEKILKNSTDSQAHTQERYSLHGTDLQRSADAFMAQSFGEAVGWRA